MSDRLYHVLASHTVFLLIRGVPTRPIASLGAWYGVLGAGIVVRAVFIMVILHTKII